ncbi:unnamed protein product [Brassica oleracea var. botrytis]
MDPDDPTSIIFKKIRTLEPDNAPKLIGYFLLQDMEQTDLIRLAFGPDTLLQTFCRQAKSVLGLSSNGNHISRPHHHQLLSQSSPSNGFFDFSRNPNPNFDSSPFRDGEEQQLSNRLSFPDEEDPFASLHKRSFSADGEPEEPGFGVGGGGAGYRFPQTGLVDGFDSSGVESGYVCLQREGMMRMKLAQQQRMAQLMALRQGEESGYYYSPSRHERDDSVSRQIYLTFPSESSFTDADVSSYFSDFGAVEDVRIPYQQQRMYGFVTFSNAETVRIVLARGNPHFICDSRVLVKPYKEKGKILQNKWQQQQLQQLLERGSYSASSSPSEMDLYECHLGPRMFSRNTQEMMRRKADAQHAIEVELQRRRFLALQLPGRENESVHHLQRSLSIGSPSHLPPRFNHSLLFQPESSMEETTEGCDSDRGESHLHLVPNNNKVCGYSNEFHKRQETSPENTLPDSLFGFPIKSEEALQTESDTKAEEWVCVEKEKEENFNHLMDSSVERTRDPCCLMKTHFLKPYVTSIDGPVAELPRRRRVSVSSSDVKVPTLRSFGNGAGSIDRNFISWMRKMEALHEPTWRKAGIFEAIKASTFKISKNPSLIQALVDKWCPETKSFVFPWGEATITLEDVMVLLGFSVLGSSVFASVESSEMRDAVKKLEKARTKIMGGKGGQVRQSQWTLRFGDRDDPLEHEAFLAMWLSHLVFPHMSRRSISRHVFPVAVRLARGERVALAPAVLASVYRDLGAITGDESYHPKSLLKLVQVWTWERFKNVRPKAKEIPKGEPRISRWDGLQKKYENVRLSLDDFEWRPYTKPLQNWNPLRFYVEEAMWVNVDNSLDDEFVAFARCVRSSQLVGIGFVEDYYPNRVAIQFGFSQDLPGLVTRHSSDYTEKEAWDDYNKSLVGLKLYMPSRLAAGSVTMRYRDWWVKSVSQFLGFEESNETCGASNAGDDGAFPEAQPLSEVLQKLGEGFPAKLKRPRKLRIARRMGSVSVEMPLSELFHKELAKRTSEHLRGKRAREDDDDDENHTDSYDDITISQLVKCRKKDVGDTSESLGIRRRDKEYKKDSRICQELASKDNETVAPQVIEPQNDEEETRSEAVETVVMIPCIGDTVLSPMKAGETCVDVNRSEAVETVVDAGTKEAECVLHDERLKHRKLTTEELALNLEARFMKVKNTLATIRNWITKRNHIQTGLSA